MAKIYRYIEDAHNNIKIVEDEIKQIDLALDKIKNDTKIVIPLETSYVTTDTIRITIGSELEELMTSIKFISITDVDNKPLYNFETDIEEITTPYPWEMYARPLNSILTPPAQGEAQYFIQKHNPCIIYIKFKEVKNIKSIVLNLKDRRDISGEPCIWQFMNVSYKNMKRSEETNSDQFFYIECKLKPFSPIDGIYSVDFSLIEGKRYTIDVDESKLVTMKEFNRILQDYIKNDSVENLFNKNYYKFVNDVADEVMRRIEEKNKPKKKI